MSAPQGSSPPTRWIAVTYVFAAVALALASTLVIHGSANAEAGESADGSATAACALFDQVEDDLEGGASKDTQIDIMRLSSTQSLCMLVSTQDDSFRGLSEVLMEPRWTARAEFDYASDKVADVIERARKACADEGL